MRLENINLAVISKLKKNMAQSETDLTVVEFDNQCVNFYNQELHKYRGLNFRSRSEIEIAKELDRRGVVYLPNCIARVHKGLKHHNLEADFLIWYANNCWILEVDGDEWHGDRAKDAKRDEMFRQSGIAVGRYRASDCYNLPKDVVSDFLQKNTE